MAYGYETDGEVLDTQGGLLRAHGQHVMSMADRFVNEATLPEGAFSNLLSDLQASYVAAMSMVRATMFNVGSVFDATGSAMQDAARSYVELDRGAVEELIRAQREPAAVAERDQNSPG